MARSLIAAWSLDLVLAALKGHPFERIRNVSLKHLTWKTVFLLAIASVRRASELHVLCYKEPYLAMSSACVVLYPNIEFLLKVNSRFHVTQPIEVLAMHGEVQPGLHLLCVR